MGKPVTLWNVSMVTSPDEKGVLMFGGRSSLGFNRNMVCKMVPIADNKFEWLAPYLGFEGRFELTSRLGKENSK